MMDDRQADPIKSALNFPMGDKRFLNFYKNRFTYLEFFNTKSWFTGHKFKS